MQWWLRILHDLLPLLLTAVKEQRGRDSRKSWHILVLVKQSQKRALECGAAELAELDARKKLIKKSEKLLGSKPGARSAVRRACVDVARETDFRRGLMRRLGRQSGKTNRRRGAQDGSASAPRSRKAWRVVEKLLDEALFDPTAPTAKRKAIKTVLLEEKCLRLKQDARTLTQLEMQESVLRRIARFLKGVAGAQEKLKELLANTVSLKDLRRAQIVVGKSILKIYRSVPTDKAGLTKVLARQEAARCKLATTSIQDHRDRRHSRPHACGRVSRLKSRS